MLITAIFTTVAAGLFFLLFSFSGDWGLDFWWWMTSNIGLLLLFVIYADPEWRIALVNDFRDRFYQKVWLGLVTAVFLYLAFMIGNYIAQLWFDFAKTDIAAVYDYKSGVSPIRIGLLLILVIGPGEELFWRGFVQRRMQAEIGLWPGFILTTAIYSLIHIGSGNIMLVMAAAICGLFWGYLYLRYQSMVLNAISHIIWDILIFLILPVAI